MSNFDAGGFDDFAPAASTEDFPRRRSTTESFPRRSDQPRRTTSSRDDIVERRASEPPAPQLKERPPAWQPDAAVDQCPTCRSRFETFARRHHCRYCGGVFCYNCTQRSMLMPPQWEGLCGYATRDPPGFTSGEDDDLDTAFEKRWVSKAEEEDIDRAFADDAPE